MKEIKDSSAGGESNEYAAIDYDFAIIEEHLRHELNNLKEGITNEAFPPVNKMYTTLQIYTHEAMHCLRQSIETPDQDEVYKQLRHAQEYLRLVPIGATETLRFLEESPTEDPYAYQFAAIGLYAQDLHDITTDAPPNPENESRIRELLTVRNSLFAPERFEGDLYLSRLLCVAQNTRNLGLDIAEQLVNQVEKDGYMPNSSESYLCMVGLLYRAHPDKEVRSSYKRLYDSFFEREVDLFTPLREVDLLLNPDGLRINRLLG